MEWNDIEKEKPLLDETILVYRTNAAIPYQLAVYTTNPYNKQQNAFVDYTQLTIGDPDPIVFNNVIQWTRISMPVIEN